MASGLQQYTQAGNMKPPSRRLIVQWVIIIERSKLSKEIIVNSFKSAHLILLLTGQRIQRLTALRREKRVRQELSS